MKAKRIKMSMSVVSAGVLAFAVSASAAMRTLPTPPPSEYADAESSVCVPLDPSRGPLVRLRIAADFTPTNAVIVDIGTDADNDGDLSPEETEVRLGCDCEEWLAPNPFTLKLRQRKLAKITSHNLTSTNLVVSLSRVGTAIFVR